MGSCFSSSHKVDSTLAAKTSYLATSQSISSSAPSASTCSTTDGTLPALRTEEEILSSTNLKAFAFNDLKTATRNFRPDSLVGEGGFGYVYKGWIDEQSLAPARPISGMMVAVKKLKPEGSQGHKEWLAEVNYLGQLRHSQLVRLIGYCLEGDNRLLVYEFVPRGSLENHLFRKDAEPLPWATRIGVATGAARGLSFLHESKIIYRDVKSANILLDMDFNAKLSDFGLAKDGPTGDKTHVSTLVMGTHGYAAPEYIATGRLSMKADVYSFGVVLLELLTGRRAFDKGKSGAEQNLVEWAKPFLEDKRKLHQIMDKRLGGKYPKKAAHELAVIAFKCIASNPKQRPPMSDVVAALEKLLQDNKKRNSLASVGTDTKGGASRKVSEFEKLTG